MLKVSRYEVRVGYFRTPQVGSGLGMKHFLGDRPKLQECWENIKREITSILNVDLPLNALDYISGCMSRSILSGTRETFVND